MKKILAFILVIVLVCAMPFSAFAEEANSDAAGEGEPIVDNLSTEDETVTEDENEDEEVAPEPTPEPEQTPTPTPTPEVIPSPEPTDTDPEIDPDSEVQTVTEKIKAWFERNSGALGIIITIISYGIALLKSIKRSNKTIATANNNSITISESNGRLMTEALKELKVASALVTEIRRTKEERDRAEKSLAEVSAYLKATRMANIELANEVADLLVYAKLPDSKKDEMYARHRAAVAAIEEVEKAAEKTEVMDNVETE